MTSAPDTAQAAGPPSAPASRGVRLADWADGRLGLYALAKSNLRKIFPDHWSFMLGEISLYTFVVIILTGVYLTLFFHPSMNEVTYDGPYTPLRGITVSDAFSSTMTISYEVRGGLLVRQIHHWAAIIFIAAMFVHMMRVFFTGGFRKPRELNWVFGWLLLFLGMFDGFLGYSLPDDLLSGTGVRFMEGALLSVPIVGTYLSFFLFGGQFPGQEFVPRFFTVHVLLIPGVMLGLLAAHLILVFYHKHTQFPGPGKTGDNVVGMPLWPVYTAKAGGFFFLVFGVLSAASALVTVNPIWVYGPYRPDQVTTDAQPDWYMGYSEGLVRIMPGWEINAWGHTLELGVLIPLVVFPMVLGFLGVYPFLEAWVTDGRREHHVLDRPRDRPVRTAIGAAWISLYLLLLLAGGNDIVATRFHLSVNAITWAVRIGVLVVPVVVFVIAKRWCLGLQRRDRDKVLHGREAGVIKRLSHGEYVEIHERLPQAALYTLTQHEQPGPIEVGPVVDENGVERKPRALTRLRAKLSGVYYGAGAQMPKATVDEYKEITRGHG